MWEVQTFESGTQIVLDSQQPWPHFYVYGPGGRDETDGDRNRYKVCCDLRDYMNGGQRPAWLDDLRRTDEHSACDIDGTSITATGPSIDIDPPNLHWVQDESEDAKNARARLMDRIFLPQKGSP